MRNSSNAEWNINCPYVVITKHDKTRVESVDITHLSEAFKPILKKTLDLNNRD